MNQKTTIVEINKVANNVLQNLPDRNALILIIIVVAIFPLQMAFNTASSPDGYVYAFGTDELVQAATANSYKWNFQNPYGPDSENVFKNPVLGSVYLQTFFGFLAAITASSPLLIIHVFSIIFSLIFYIVLYKLFGVYIESKNKKLTCLIFFIIVSGGFGGILYILLGNVLTTSQLIHLLNSGGLAGSMLVYQLISAVFGLAALYTTIKYKEKLTAEWKKTALFLGISALIYPLYSLVFLAMIVIANLMKKDYKTTAASITAEIIFLIPWIPALLSGGAYSQYLQKADYINIFVYAELGFFLVVLSAYFLYYNVKHRKWGYESTFLVIWLVIFVILTVMPPLPPIQPQRLLQLSWIPLSIAATLGFFEIMRNRNFGNNAVRLSIAIIILVSLPTTILWYGNGFSQDIEQSYLTEDEMNTMEYLAGQEEGRLLSSPEIGLRAPVLAEKRALMSGVETFDSALEDYETFISESTLSLERKLIADKYDIEYIITDSDMETEGFSQIYTSGDVSVFKRD